MGEKFKKTRKRDKNLELAISDSNKQMPFYIYKESAYNTFNENLVEKLKVKNILSKEMVVLKTYKLEYVFDNFLSSNKYIDFLSIDAEGFDLKVLKSNNWKKYRPKFVLIETHDFDVDNLDNCEIVNFLYNLDYKLIAVTKLTLIFKYE